MQQNTSPFSFSARLNFKSVKKSSSVACKELMAVSWMIGHTQKVLLKKIYKGKCKQVTHTNLKLKAKHPSC